MCVSFDQSNRIDSIIKPNEGGKWNVFDVMEVVWLVIRAIRRNCRNRPMCFCLSKRSQTLARRFVLAAICELNFVFIAIDGAADWTPSRLHNPDDFSLVRSAWRCISAEKKPISINSKSLIIIKSLTDWIISATNGGRGEKKLWSRRRFGQRNIKSLPIKSRFCCLFGGEALNKFDTFGFASRSSLEGEQKKCLEWVHLMFPLIAASLAAALGRFSPRFSFCSAAKRRKSK